MTRIRWLILIIGPLPIVGSSWAVSAWFRDEPRRSGATTRSSMRRQRPCADAAHTRQVTARPAAGESLDAACLQSAERLRKRAGPGLQVIVRTPFVLGGDLDDDELAACYTDSIAPAVQAMQARYFRTRPHRPITVLVFRDEEGYNRYSQRAVRRQRHLGLRLLQAPQSARSC